MCVYTKTRQNILYIKNFTGGSEGYYILINVHINKLYINEFIIHYIYINKSFLQESINLYNTNLIVLNREVFEGQILKIAIAHLSRMDRIVK
jgi:hypothetical protein